MALGGHDLMQPAHGIRHANLVAALLRHPDRLAHREGRKLQVSKPDREPNTYTNNPPPQKSRGMFFLLK